MNIIINGVFGKMGKVLTEIIGKRQDMAVSAGIDITEPQFQPPFQFFKSISDCDVNADIIIDFSVPGAVDAALDYAVLKKLPIIVCTTGLSEATEHKIDEASSSIPVFKSANMSVGISLLSALLKKVSNTLYDLDFDIEIIETHHNQKIDAPSGTALMLAESINTAFDDPLRQVNDRSLTRKKRERGEIGMHSIRGGTITGKHSVLFAGRDETLELTHSSSSKEIYAVGAVSAAEFLIGKPAGLYDMSDIFSDLIS